MLNHYFFALITTSITHAVLALFVYFKGHKRLTNISYALYSASIALWSGAEAFAITSLSNNSALWLWRLNHVGVTFIPICFVHFVISLLSPADQARRKTLVVCSYVIGLVSLFLNFQGFLFNEVGPKFQFRFFIYPKPPYFVFFFLWVLWAMYGLAELFKLYLQSDPVKKNQLSYFSISMLVAYLGGIPNFLPTFNIEIPFLMPFGTYAISIYAFFTAYAIVAYRLMDIEIIIRRTVVFAGLVGFVFGVFSAATFLVREVLSRFIGMSDAWTSAISIILIVVGFEPIRNLLVNITDQYLFQKKYDYQKLLKDATKGIATIESLNHLLGLVVHFITMRMRVKSAAVLTKIPGSTEFKLGYERGYKKRYLEYVVDEASPLMQYLAREKGATDLDRIKEYAEVGTKKHKRKSGQQYDFRTIQAQMEEIQASCCVPSFLGEELRSVLVLGEKKSGDYYTDEDLNVLFTLAQESAIAIENARLYDEAINKSRELERINQQLEFARQRLTKALQETEAANKQLQDTQAQLIHEQKMATLGRLAASVGHEVNNPLTILSMNVSRAILKYRKNPDLKVLEVMDIFQKMEQNISRIKAVVNTLTGLLKKSEKGKFEPLSLKLILEETLPLVQFQTYLDNLVNPDVEFDVPGNIPLVRGDLERLQEVFLNLFINAYHAMAGRMNPRISIRAEVESQTPYLVAVHFTDNGEGMTDDTMKKIFHYGFTTKPPGRGSGMGLYMCKYIIELHGGSIKVESHQGQGTTFTLTLPIYEEATMSGVGQQASAG